jgi:hypothetical protein
MRSYVLCFLESHHPICTPSKDYQHQQKPGMSKCTKYTDLFE